MKNVSDYAADKQKRFVTGNNGFMSHAEQELKFQIRAAGLPAPVEQFRFCSTRKWRADFCWTGKIMLIVEVDGGTWVQGRHSRGTGYEKDCEKLAMAVVLGYRVMRFTTNQVKSGFALSMIEAVIKGSVVT